MNYKFKDYVGVFLISGGKNSILSLDMYYLQFINRIGIIVEIENSTVTDEDYIKYLQRKYNMIIMKVNFHKTSYENFLLNLENSTNQLSLLSNPIYAGLSEIRKLLLTLQINKYKIIIGSNKTYPLTLKENSIMINPLSKLTEEEVIEECKKRELELISTYSQGFEKHDCFPDILWGHINPTKLKEKVNLLKKNFPDRYKYWSSWEKENNKPFFITKKKGYQWIHKL
ncbi:MAG: hypothetical protein ACNI22_06635 [Halarcobacter sp.]